MKKYLYIFERVQYKKKFLISTHMLCFVENKIEQVSVHVSKRRKPSTLGSISMDENRVH